MIRKRKWLRTDERDDAIRSLQLVADISKQLKTDPYKWKWLFIALHNATQGFIVLTLSKGNNLLVLRPDIAKKWLKAYELDDSQYPVEKLDDFLSLYKKIKDPKYFTAPFVSQAVHDRDLVRLNNIRNKFIHFTPSGWSLELAGLPRIVCNSLDVVEWCISDDGGILWYADSHRKKATSALKRARKTMMTLS